VPKAKSFPSLGRRVAAAIASYTAGHSGVDRILKQFTHTKESAWWEKKARELQAEATGRAGQRIRIVQPGSKRVQ
jgi:hypothetical protein